MAKTYILIKKSLIILNRKVNTALSHFSPKVIKFSQNSSVDYSFLSNTTIEAIILDIPLSVQHNKKVTYSLTLRVLSEKVCHPILV